MELTALLPLFVGFLGAVLGSIVGPWLQSRWGDASKLRDLRTTLYAEAMAHAYLVSLKLDALVWPYESAMSASRREDRRAVQPSVELITSRMLLIGHDSVRAAWLKTG